MASSPASEPDLPTIQRALAGDVPALARVYVGFHPLVLRLAQRTLARLRLDDAPCELAAEVWLRLLDHGCRALRPFDPARGSFRGFIEMVAWQQALVIAQRWQRRALHERSFPPAEPSEPLTPCTTTALHHRLLLDRMIAAVPRLTALDHTLLVESLLGQTPLPELAARLGHGVVTLRSRNQRLRARLRDAARTIEHEPLSCAA